MGKKQSIADILGLTPAQEEERLSGLRRLARAIMAAIRKVVAFLFGGIVGDIGRDVAAVKGLAGRAAISGAHGVEGVGKGLDLGYRVTHGIAKGVGSILGALVPRPPVGPADVAAAAAAQEDRRGRRSDDIRDRVASALAPGATVPVATAISQPNPSPTETVALVRESVAMMQRQDMAASDVITRLPYRIGKWLLTLDANDLTRLAALPSGPLHRHVTGVEAAPGLTPVTTVSHDLLPSFDELARIMRLSTQSAAQEKYEVAAMAKRPGSAPRPRMPTEPAYGDEALSIFAASPKPARSY